MVGDARTVAGICWRFSTAARATHPETRNKNIPWL